MAFPTYERRFLVRLQARDERAFNRLVKDYQDPIYGFCVRMLRSREDAREVAQDVFFSAFRAFPKFRGESKVSTWLFRIATNQCRNRLKKLSSAKQKFMVSFTERAAANGAVNSGNQRFSRPDTLFEGRELEALLNQWISELDHEQREVILLRDFQQMSYDEISVITQTPPGTVKSRLHRGRLELKKRVEEFQRGRAPEDATNNPLSMTLAPSITGGKSS